MPKHYENAHAIAKHLKNHPKVSWVSFPGLENDSQHELAKNIFQTAHAVSFHSELQAAEKRQ